MGWRLEHSQAPNTHHFPGFWKTALVARADNLSRWWHIHREFSGEMFFQSDRLVGSSKTPSTRQVTLKHHLTINTKALPLELDEPIYCELSARWYPPDMASIQQLSPEHREIFSQAISTILSTSVAEFTYAQILDGLPTLEVFRDRYYRSLHIDHPLQYHTELCPGVLDRMRHYRDVFHPTDLLFEDRLLKAFQEAPIGSRAFKMRLIEMVAVAVHSIAVMIINLGEGLHDDDGITSWMPRRDPRASPPLSHLRNLPPPVTLFYHRAYQLKDKYPHGVADIVGYWAENQILGGVVIFDRGKSGFDCNDIYFHSDRNGVTYRIYKLLDIQFETLANFLLTSSSKCPLPILGDKMNRDRVDLDDAISHHGIFRDRWERAIPVKDEDYWRRQRDVQNDLDYPEIEDQMEAFRRAREGRDS